MGKHYSYSRLDLYNSCPLAYKRRYIEKRPEQRSAALLIGSAFHAAAAAYVGHLVGNRLSTDITYDALPEARAAMEGEGKVLTPDEWAEVAELAAHFADSFMLEPERYIEHEKMQKINCLDYTWWGVMDLLETYTPDTCLITDFKSDRALRSQADVERDFQLRVYAWMAHVLYHYDKVIARLWFARFGVVREVEFGLDEIEQAGQEIAAAVAAIEADHAFTPTPGSHCSWCSWSEDCPAISSEPLLARSLPEAHRLAGEVLVLEKQIDERKKLLNKWCALNGPLEINGQCFAHHESRSPKVTDIRRFLALVPDAADYLNVDGRKLPGLVKKMNGELEGILSENVSTSFKHKKVSA